MPMLVVSIAGIVLFMNEPSVSQLYMLLPAQGFFLGGPMAIIGGAVTADLGSHPSLGGDTRALATVTGIIDGIGSTGAAVGQYLVAILAKCGAEGGSNTCNWTPVFMMMAYALCLSTACLIVTFMKDLRYLCRY